MECAGRGRGSGNPQDLAIACSKNKTAREYFEALPRSVKRGILEWIISAKKPETRAKRVEETVTKAEKNIRANQRRQQLRKFSDSV